MNNFKLHDQPKITNGFIVPENYFDNFSGRLQPKLVAQTNKVSAITAVIKLHKSWITSAAALLVLTISSVVYSNFQLQKKQKYSSDLENYISNNVNFTDDDIVNLLNSEQIKLIKFDSKLNSETIENHLIASAYLETIIIN